MQIVRNLMNFKSPHHDGAGTIVTIGNYDGIHLGHQAILKKVRALATKLSLPSIVVTFAPSPREYFTHSPLPQRLMSWREKILTLRNYNLDQLLLIRFNQQFAQLSPIAFIHDILVRRLNARYIVVGDDFVFGYQSSGNIQLLKTYSVQLGFNVSTVPTYRMDHHRISSSLIRQALLNDNLKTAQKFLGHHYNIIGRVIKGNQLGRNIDFPTANIHISPKIITLTGVYAVKIWRFIGRQPSLQPSSQRPQALYGIANIGFRPTIQNIQNTLTTKPIRLLECHIFDFQENIYGEILKIEFIHKLRDEQKFANFTLLQQQIKRDVIAAKKYFVTRENHVR